MSEDICMYENRYAIYGSWEKRKLAARLFVIVQAGFFLILTAAFIITSVYAKNDLFSDLFKGLAFTRDISRFFAISGRYFQIIQENTKALYGTLRNLCFLIAGAGCLFGLLDSPARGDILSPGVLSRAAVQYTIAATLISNCSAILDGVNSIGRSVMNAASSWNSSVLDVQVTSWYDMFRAEAGEGNGIWVIALSFFLQIVLYFNIILARISVYKFCFICLIELGLRGMFLPLGVSWASLEGIRGRWLPYLKGYGGVYVKIAAFYMIAYLAGVFMSTAAGDGVTNITNCIYIVSLCRMVPALMGTVDPIIADVVNG